VGVAKRFRCAPGDAFPGDPVGAGQGPPVTLFADTRGILRFSAGDGAMVASSASEADLGTAFALGPRCMATACFS